VTSGIYLLTRVNGVIAEAASWAPNIIAWVGVGTALFAATIAVAQNDIKKVLAYSTVSQLGYMFLAVGTGAYVAAIFHMVTHAFFKALLFLGSGSVIHGMHHDQDMRHYGALRKLLPITAATFIIGWLAIAGVPPFAGFWSKDEILLSAWDKGGLNGKALWAVGLLTALLTAFYMTRQVIMTFFGRYRYDDPTPEEISEAWDGRLAASQADVELAMAAETTAIENVAKAKAGIATAETNLEMMKANVPIAAANLENSQAALTQATDDTREQLAAQVTAAENAVTAGENNVVAATTGIETARSKVPEAEQALLETQSSQSQTADAHHEVERKREYAPVPDPVALFDAPAVSAVEEFLPSDIAQRREFHPHESPWTMTIPLVVLAVLAIFGGLLNLPFSWNNNWLHHLEHWLEPTLAHEHVIHASAATKVLLAAVAVAAGAIGIFAAYAVYAKGRNVDPATIEKPVLANGWFYDRLVSDFMGGPGRKLFDLVAWFDTTVVDGIVNGAGAAVRGVGGTVRRTQTGLVRSYAAVMALGAVALIAWFFVRASL
ncbi:MAG: proton-conducting transporter membrane subunit, partial [Acidimicrobiales bacterium]